MCYFAHLGVRIVDDQRRFPDPAVFATDIQRSANESGFALEPLIPVSGSFLSRAMASYQLRFTFHVGHCACDWADDEIKRVKQLVSRILTAREVKAVAFLLYMIDGPLAESTPSPPNSPPHSIDVSTKEFVIQRDLRDKISIVRRSAGEVPSTSLRSI